MISVVLKYETASVNRKQQGLCFWKILWFMIILHLIKICLFKPRKNSRKPQCFRFYMACKKALMYTIGFISNFITWLGFICSFRGLHYIKETPDYCLASKKVAVALIIPRGTRTPPVSFCVSSESFCKKKSCYIHR